VLIVHLKHSDFLDIPISLILERYNSDWIAVSTTDTDMELLLGLPVLPVRFVLCGRLTFNPHFAPTVVDILSIAELVSIRHARDMGPHLYAQTIYATLQRIFPRYSEDTFPETGLLSLNDTDIDGIAAAFPNMPKILDRKVSHNGSVLEPLSDVCLCFCCSFVDTNKTISSGQRCYGQP
jgi:hypothetical protein